MRRPFHLLWLAKARRHAWAAILVTVVAGLSLGGWLRHLSQGPSAPPTVAQLIRALQKQDSRLDALHQTVWVFLPGFVQRAIPILTPRPASVLRAEAAVTLGNRGAAAQRAVPALIKALADPDLSVRQAAVDALGSMGVLAKGAVPALLPLLADLANGPYPRILAISALANVGVEDPIVLDALLDLAKGDPDVAVRATALRSLPRLRPPSTKALILLTNSVTSATPEIADAAVSGLGEFGAFAAEAVPLLLWRFEHPIELADSGQFSARLLAQYGLVPAPALRMMPQPQAAPGGGVSTNQTGTGTSAPVPSLQTNTAAQFRPAKARTRQFPPGATAPPVTFTYVSRPSAPEVGLATSLVLDAIGRIGPAAKAALPRVVSESTNAASRYRYQAALVRWRIEENSESVLPLFRLGLKEPSWVLRAGVVDFIAHLGRSGVPLLREALRDPTTQVRWAAVEALGRAGAAADESVSDLEQLLAADPKICIRVAAAKTLKKVRPGQSAEWDAKLARAMPILLPLNSTEGFKARSDQVPQQ